MSRKPISEPLRQPGAGLRRPTGAPQETQVHLRQPSNNRDDEKGGAFGMMLDGDYSDDDDDAPAPPPPAATRTPQRPPPARQNSNPSNRSPPQAHRSPSQVHRLPPGLGSNPSGRPMPAQSPPPPGPITRPTQALQPSPQPATRAAFINQPPPLLRPGTAEPHPLQIPSTPIVAKFTQHDEFAKNRTTVFGDEFWTRFNKAATHDQKAKNPLPEKQGGGQRGSTVGQSSFLREYGAANGRMRKWIWACSILLLIAIVGGIAAGWYFSRNDPSTKPSVLVGDSGNENSLSSKGAQATSTPSSSGGGGSRRMRHRRLAQELNHLEVD